SHAVINDNLSARITPVQIGNPELFHKSASVLFFVLDVHSQKNYASVFVFLPGAFKRTGFCPARHAPRSPKVHKHRLAPKIGKPDHFAVEQRQTERRSLSGNQWTLDIACIWCKSLRVQAD